MVARVRRVRAVLPAHTRRSPTPGMKVYCFVILNSKTELELRLAQLEVQKYDSQGTNTICSSPTKP